MKLIFYINMLRFKFKLTSHEIAEHLLISPRMVENHRFSLMQKLNVKNKAGMAKAALEMGLI